MANFTVSLCLCSMAMAIFLAPRIVFSATQQSEIDVLRNLKQTIDPNSIPASSFLSTWDFKLDPCESTGAHFLGILCTIPEGNMSSRVTAIDLDGAGYDGFLTKDIGTLSELTLLNLSKNKFRGPIPDNLPNLEKLTTLTISENFFTGSLPDGMRRLKRLEVLDLSNNKFTGQVPTWITGFRSLQSLRMSSNGFSGRIPNLAGLWQLNELALSNNQLYGTLPQLPTSLTILSLSHNLLSGHIYSISRLQQLQELDLSDNRFNESISKGVLTLPEMISTNFSVNWFTAIDVPKFSGMSTELQVLDAQMNRLRGHLPQNLVTMLNLTIVNLSHNQFSGAIPRDYGARLGASWNTLYLNHNYLVGNLPLEFNNTRVRIEGSLAQNCLSCPANVALCGGGQRPTSECVGQTDINE